MSRRPASDLLAQGLRQHQAGRLEAAGRLYRQVLAREPGNANALNLLGLVAHRSGRTDDALDLLRQAVARHPASALFLRNLASVQQAAGALADAIASFRRAHDLAPEDAGILNDLGTALNAARQTSAAADAFRRAAALAPEAAAIHYNLGNAELKRGHREAAVRAFRRAVAADPELHRARHILDALTGRQSDRPPDDYVRHLFDDYAERFESDLVETLGYRVPSLLRQALERLPDASRRFAAALDLGCGTGLSGAAFRDIVDRLRGVDLSPGMIAKADGRGIYDALVTAPIVDMLEADDDRYDLILATDVLVYIGDLAALFAALPARCADGALFLFSTESAEGDSFVLRDSGRFAHAPAYVRRLAAAQGFGLLFSQPVDIRQGPDGPVAGEVYILRKE